MGCYYGFRTAPIFDFLTIYHKKENKRLSEFCEKIKNAIIKYKIKKYFLQKHLLFNFIAD